MGKPIKDYFESQSATANGLTSCDFFTKPTSQGGVTFKAANDYALAMGIWDYAELQSDTCNCDSCMCTGVPTPQVLHKAFTNEGTSSVFWSPAGEHMPHCKGSCPSKQERRFQFTTDFSSLMQEVVSLPDWKQGNAMALVIDGHSDFDDTPSLRSYESFDGTSTGGYSWTSRSPTHGPTIYVAWCLPPPPAGQAHLQDGGGGRQAVGDPDDCPEGCGEGVSVLWPPSQCYSRNKAKCLSGNVCSTTSGERLGPRSMGGLIPGPVKASDACGRCVGCWMFVCHITTI